MSPWLEKHRAFLHFTPTVPLAKSGMSVGLGKITRKRIAVHFQSVPELIEAIPRVIRINNQNPKPFVWTKKVDQIGKKSAV